MTQHTASIRALDADWPLHDRGVAFGDGVFETLFVARGQLYAWPQHYARLSAGLSRLALPPICEQWLLMEIRNCVFAQSKPEAEWIIKLIVSAGSSRQGYRRDQHSLLSVRLWAKPAPVMHVAPLEVGLAKLPLGGWQFGAGLKTLNRLEQVMAAERGCGRQDDCLQTDPDGFITGATSSNFFWREGGRWFTPPITQAGITGTRRALWIEQLTANIQPLRHGRLAAVEQAFLSNAVNACRPIGWLQGRALQSVAIPAAVKLESHGAGYQFAQPVVDLAAVTANHRLTQQDETPA